MVFQLYYNLSTTHVWANPMFVILFLTFLLSIRQAPDRFSQPKVLSGTGSILRAPLVYILQMLSEVYHTADARMHWALNSVSFGCLFWVSQQAQSGVNVFPFTNNLQIGDREN